MGHEALGGSTGIASRGVLLGACSSAGTSPASPGPFASQADQVVADLAAGNFTAVEGKLDPTMIMLS
jgi:hypothetical protein